MRGIRGWILRRVLRSALVFEREATGLYASLHDKLDGPSAAGVRHLLEEERIHQKLLEDIVSGRIRDQALEEILASHRFHAFEEIQPLDQKERAAYGATLEQALRDEEATVSFYDNLERIGKIPAVKRAFKVLADMEREHAAILRQLLGLAAAKP